MADRDKMYVSIIATLASLLSVSCGAEPSKTGANAVDSSAADKETADPVHAADTGAADIRKQRVSDSRPLECNLGSWTKIFTAPNPGWFTAVWAEDANNIFVAGKFRPSDNPDNWSFPVFHFSGQQWTAHPTEAISAIWSLNGTSSDNVYGVGGYRAIHRWDGNRWTQEHFDPAVSVRRRLDTIYIDASGNVSVFGESVFQKKADSWNLLHKGSVDAAVWGSFYRNITKQPVPPGLPATVSKTTCRKISDTWVCTHGERIFSYQEGRWRSGTFPDSCLPKTKLSGRWYAGCFKGLRRRDDLSGTDPWEKIDAAAHWDVAAVLSHGELISTDRKGNWYMLGQTGIQAYAVDSTGFIVPFEIGDQLIAASGTSVYCMKRPLSSDD